MDLGLATFFVLGDFLVDLRAGLGTFTLLTGKFVVQFEEEKSLGLVVLSWILAPFQCPVKIALSSFADLEYGSMHNTGEVNILASTVRFNDDCIWRLVEVVDGVANREDRTIGDIGTKDVTEYFTAASWTG
jgi:hypothetical protein